MKTIGLVGGTGWISSAEYYRIINEEVNRRRGGLNFAKCILFSLDYGAINEFNRKNDTEGVLNLVLDAAKKLAAIGSDCIVLCANTMHMHAEIIQKAVAIPLIHIAEATANEIQQKKINTIGLLGTKMTMERDFYKSKFSQANIISLIPDQSERDFIHRTINEELLKGIFKQTSKQHFLDIIGKLHSRGAEGIVLGCTEIPLLISKDDLDIPLFNTTVIHSMAAVDFALGEGR